MASVPVLTSGDGGGGIGALDAAMQRGLASQRLMMEKQIEFTTKSNPLKAGDSIAKGSRMG